MSSKSPILSNLAGELLAKRQSKGLKFADYQEDIIGFGRDVLGMQAWSRQEELLLAIQSEPAVACRSGHKTGKSTSAGWAALWFYCCFERARVIMTAPTHRQIRAILWKETRRLYAAAQQPLGGHLHELPESGLQATDGREIIGFFTKDPEKMAGFSGPNILFIVDEASGIPSNIFDAIEGNRAGGARILMLSNPTQVTGDFYEAFNSRRNEWKGIHISSWEAAMHGPPNVGLARRDWCEQKKRVWGENNPLYQIRVLGNFPKQAKNSVISASVVEAAIARHAEQEPPYAGRLVLGVDVARFGDDHSVVAARRDTRALCLRQVQGQDTVAIAHMALGVAKELRHQGEVVYVAVDTIGVGAGVADTLRAMKLPWLHVLDVNVSEVANDPEKYPNLRSELWFLTEEWLHEGAIPADDELSGELVAPLYTFDKKGRREVESKKDLKLRLKRSPDKADALCLTMAARSIEAFSSAPIEGRESTESGEEDRMTPEDDALAYGASRYAT